ncbi:hypothetical protein C7S18_19600 [Ahniella affigens]|uniref:Uncharacterized protein n=2 Tax=Ahniella affigens TaxID=2021234 RepID=A0A2P1PWK0_9GAMM|nr:hypothetical protein C7S18_19600 [Ahniella affigens]
MVLAILASATVDARPAGPLVSVEAAPQPVLRECPANLLKDVVLQNTLRVSRSVQVRDGEVVHVDRFALDGNAQCAVQTAPTFVALKPDDALLAPIDVSDVSDVLSLADSKGKDTPSGNSWACTVRGKNIAVYAGRCGSGGGLIGSAFFVAPNFALSGGSIWNGFQGNACLIEGTSSAPSAYYDVHTVNVAGSGSNTLVGLGLMQTGPGTSGVQAQDSPLYVSGQPFRSASVEGKFQNYFTCKSGPVVSDQNGLARIDYTYVNDPFPPAPFPLDVGGPAFLGVSGNTTPIGVHIFEGSVSVPYPYLTPFFRRFTSADTGLIGTWMQAAVPTSTQAVTITSPTFGSVVNSNLPLNVAVTAPGGFALELDGAPVATPISNLSPGVHTLTAYKPGLPQYRHTIRFTAEAQVYVDNYEFDNTPETYKALYADQPQTHTFHLYNDQDWTAFAVGNGTRINLSMVGSNFGTCSMTLYRHPDYPNGTRELVTSTAGPCQALSLNVDSPVSPSIHVYFLETRLQGAYSGNNTSYVLTATTQQVPVAADSYEADNSREQFVALYAGAPQDHNFHQEGDVDWTAFAVGPSVPVQVRVTGNGADRSRIRLYRQTNYPYGPIDLIGTHEATNPLLLSDQISHNGPYTVYYVETSAIWSGFYGLAASYTISVEAN